MIQAHATAVRLTACSRAMVFNTAITARGTILLPLAS